jgi:hypothetical protein
MMLSHSGAFYCSLCWVHSGSHFNAEMPSVPEGFFFFCIIFSLIFFCPFLPPSLHFLGFCFGSTEAWTQGLALARRVLYHVSYSSSSPLPSFFFFLSS